LKRICLGVLSLVATVAFAQTTPCPEPAILAPGSTAEGALEAADCEHQTAFPGSRITTVVKVFRMEIAARTVVTLNLSASGFDPILYLYTANRAMVGRNNNVREGETASRLSANLPAGAYLVAVTTAAADTAGVFQLEAAVEEPRNCSPVDLTLGQTIEGAFDGSTCRGLDLAAGTQISTSEILYKIYRLDVPRRGALTLRAETALETIMSVTSPAVASLFFIGGNSLTASLNPNRYEILLSADEQGSFSFTTRLEDLRVCEPAPITAGETSVGSLADGDCRILDFLVPSSNSRLADPRRLTVERPSIVTLDQQSGGIDTLALLLDSQNRLIASNDDISRDDTNSRIRIHLPDGEFIVLASSFEIVQGGYTLSATIEPPRECLPTPLTLDQPLEGTFPADGCRLMDLLLFSTSQTFAAPYSLEAPGRRIVKLDLNVPGSRGTFNLIAPPGRSVYQRNTDMDGNAALETMAPAAAYTVALTSTADPPPTFTLRGSLTEPPPCPVEDLSFDATTPGSLTSSDCRFLEIVPFSTVTTRSRQHRFTINQRSRLTIRMESQDFTPAFMMVNADDLPVTVQVAPRPGPLAITGTIVPGAYRIIATTALGSLGAYTIRAEVTPESGAAPSWQPIAPAAADALLRDPTSMQQQPAERLRGMERWRIHGLPRKILPGGIAPFDPVKIQP
jgi:hypothetical protein